MSLKTMPFFGKSGTSRMVRRRRSAIDSMAADSTSRVRNWRGSRGRVPSRTSKWRWGPVVRPVWPTFAMGVPASTRSPSFTSTALLWA